MRAEPTSRGCSHDREITLRHGRRAGRVGVAQEQASQQRADDARETERKKLQGKLDASSEAAQVKEYARQGSVREIYHESQKVIERPVYSSVCVDADGVGLLDRAAATANSEDLWGIAGDTRPIAQGAAD